MNQPKFLKYIDGISKWTGMVTSWLMIFLVLELVYDTIARYVFDAPTIWSFDVSYMLYSLMFMLAGAYVLLAKEHIRVDTIYNKFSKRGKAIVDILGYLLFFFPAIGGMFIFGITFTQQSWAILEHSTRSYWSPPLYEFKCVIPVGAFLLLLQGVAEFVRAIFDLISNERAV